MIVDDIAEINEETHIWIGNKLVFEGKYHKNNSFSKLKVYGAGYEEEIGSEPMKIYRTIELDE